MIPAKGRRTTSKPRRTSQFIVRAAPRRRRWILRFPYGPARLRSKFIIIMSLSDRRDRVYSNQRSSAETDIPNPTEIGGRSLQRPQDAGAMGLEVIYIQHSTG